MSGSSTASERRVWKGERLSLCDYDIDEKALGAGSTGIVIHASRLAHAREDIPREVAFKVLSQNDKLLSSLQKEVSMLAAVQSHANIIRFYGVCCIERKDEVLPRWAIQLEYCGAGDLHSVVAQKCFSEVRAHAVMGNILQGLTHMHERGLVHRDVKSENVLLTTCGVAKLADFGLSARLTDSIAMQKRCGTPGYVAPEVILGKKYGVKCDIFSSGVLLYFVISGRMLFRADKGETVMNNTVHRQLSFTRHTRLESLSSGCKTFMGSLLAKQPERRPTAQEALS